MDRRSFSLLAGAGAVCVIAVVAALWLGGAAAPSESGTPTPSSSAVPTLLPTLTPTQGLTPGPSVAGPSPVPSLAGTAAPTPRPEPTTEAVDVAGTWSGTWSNESPDTEEGALEITLTQVGAELEGTVTFDSNACVTTMPIQGAIVGDQITLNVLTRDEVELEGDVSGNAMSGDFSMTCNNASGTWTVRRDG